MPGYTEDSILRRSVLGWSENLRIPTVMPDRQSTQDVSIEELRVALEEARTAVAARDAFIATAIHELLNPMTPIAAQVERLREEARNSGARSEGLERLGLMVERYVQRAKTLLEVSRINAGRRRLSPETVDLSSLTQQTMQRHAPIAEWSRCQLLVSIEPSVEGLWDRLAVEQIVENLVSNAIKYGAGQPVRIEVKASGSAAQVVVQDHGAGISEDDQVRIFGPFEQAARSTGQGGFGVGLWVVRQLVEAMSGTIAVASRLGEGSTFSVSLPRDGTWEEPETP
jgi:two-component system OmpR family sensor kinase